eukprot:3499769-Pyramimonas_sp.AAC.1
MHATARLPGAIYFAVPLHARVHRHVLPRKRVRESDKSASAGRHRAPFNRAPSAALHAGKLSRAHRAHESGQRLPVDCAHTRVGIDDRSPVLREAPPRALSKRSLRCTLTSTVFHSAWP